jgi:hypothetical protein
MAAGSTDPAGTLDEAILARLDAIAAGAAEGSGDVASLAVGLIRRIGRLEAHVDELEAHVADLEAELAALVTGG